MFKETIKFAHEESADNFMDGLPGLDEVKEAH